MSLFGASLFNFIDEFIKYIEKINKIEGGRALALANYVKFRRGTPASYSALATKDPDSLYFISEQNAQTGVLYLGDKLISGSITLSTSLNDLSDVLLGNNISANSLLIYDGTQQAWVNKPFSEIFDEMTGALVEMVGATSDRDGLSGVVPQPLAGDNTKFLRGDATWVTVNEITQAQVAELGQLRTDLNGIVGNDAGSTIREIAAEEVAKVVANAPANLDTLKEIADWIADHPTSYTEIIDRVEVLETGVGDLEDAISALQAKDQDLQAQINDLDYHLRWQRVDGSEEDDD